MITIQIKYQREIDRLEKELQSLKKQLLLTQDRGQSGKKQRKIKVEFEQIFLHATQLIPSLFFFVFARDL